MLRLAASWVWDFWIADDGDDYHLFFLKASRALLDPDRRHWRATIGHATSKDLKTWTEHADAVIPDDSPAFDDLATWTGSVVRDDSGLWRMFYTAVSRSEEGLTQRISSVVSDDLYTWRREPVRQVLEPDPRWYETAATRKWPDQAWRDPWVFRDGEIWHMLITARANHGDPDNRGVVGHATSPDLATWTVEPPLSEPGSGFGHLEVIQTVVGRREARRAVLVSRIRALPRSVCGRPGRRYLGFPDGFVSRAVPDRGRIPHHRRAALRGPARPGP